MAIQRRRREEPILIDDAYILFLNFKGVEGTYNRAGDRNFCVLLEDEDADALIRKGWNVKYLRAREPGEEDQPYLKVAVSYKYRPPRAVLISSKGRTELGEDMIDILDDIDMAFVRVAIRPHHWNVNGKSGTKAYLQGIYVTMEEDRFALEANQIPEIGAPPRMAIESGDVEDPNVIDAESWDVTDQLAIGA